MEIQNRRTKTRTSSTDPIAEVSLWSVLPPLIGAGLLAWLLLGQSPGAELEKHVNALATFTPVVAWWCWVVAGATRRAGFRPSLPSVGALLKLSSKVALCGLMVKLSWKLLEHALQLPRLGLVTAPVLVTGEPTAQSFAVSVFLMALLGPVAEEMLFRGALFRKWRLRWGPGKAALVTSALFALCHANALSSVLTALSITVLYTTTRTIWAPVTAHVINNLFAVTLANGSHLLPVALLQAATHWPPQLASALPAFLGTCWLVRFVHRGWHTLGDPVHGEPASVPALVAVGS